MIILGYAMAMAMGLTLGMIGAGGSILTMPILVYVFGVSPYLATTYSLFLVGTTAAVGTITYSLKSQIDFMKAMLFGIPSIAAVYLTRLHLMPSLPPELLSVNDYSLTLDIFIMILFAILMAVASVLMLRQSHPNKKNLIHSKVLWVVIILEGLTVGMLTGILGAGGGFLIIPALVILVGMDMRVAVGSSLLIIALKSFMGFLADLQAGIAVDYPFLLTFLLFTVLGLSLGFGLSKKVSADGLKKLFGWFTLFMGIFILIKEI